MKAILKCKHLLFCNLVQAMAEKQGIKDPLLDELINEMITCFNSYTDKKEELSVISQQYEIKQRKIKQRLKEIKKMTFELNPVGLKAS